MTSPRAQPVPEPLGQGFDHINIATYNVGSRLRFSADLEELCDRNSIICLQEADGVLDLLANVAATRNFSLAQVGVSSAAAAFIAAALPVNNSKGHVALLYLWLAASTSAEAPTG